MLLSTKIFVAAGGLFQPDLATGGAGKRERELERNVHELAAFMNSTAERWTS